MAGGLFALMVTLNILTPYICDDFTYNLNFLTKEPLGSFWEIFPSMYAHSYKMNGRLISHGLMQVFMLMPSVVFDVVNAAVFTATVWLVHRLCAGERNGMLFAAVFCLLWMMTPVFGQVALWQVGAVNYFWSLTALVLFITPALAKFRSGRELLRKKRHWAFFCTLSFFFGWYSEIASFVGICMMVCLVVLDVWMNRTKLRLHRLMPVVCAVCGYITMLSMPAQRGNKQAGGLTGELILSRFEDCTRMLRQNLLPLVILFGALFILGLLVRLPRKTMVLAGLFALAGICANYMPIAASYYPERCMCTTVLMLVMACGFLAAPLFDIRPRVLCAACLILCLLAVPSGLRGCRDILSCHRQNAQREQTIAAALEQGERDVVANVVIPETPWSGFWGVRDLTDDPETWPNHSMALYYGLDSLIGK